jgi:hypothetical protein
VSRWARFLLLCLLLLLLAGWCALTTDAPDPRMGAGL